VHNSKTLPIPDDCQVNPDAFQLMAIWIAENEPRISFRSDAWEDPAIWGIVLADVVRLVAQQYQESTGQSIDNTVSRIVSGFRAELETT